MVLQEDKKNSSSFFELLFLRVLLFCQMGYTSNLDRRMKVRGAKMVSFGEMQIGNMMNALLWCGNTIDLNKRAHATMIGHDCFGRGTKAPV